MQLRQYQREAVDSIYRYFTEHNGHPLIVMPTASGKSLVLAAFIRETLEQWPNERLLVVTHVKELIQQDYKELMGLWPEAPAGIYSAGLKRREAQAQVLFCGIQSIHKRAEELGACDLILVDESHLIPRSSDTMYRRFIESMAALNDQVKIIGLTATHYRLDSGLLTEGDNRVFTDIAYEVPVKRLIDEKWLCPLVTKAPTTELDVSGVHMRGGDYIAGELAAAVDRSEINSAVVREIVHYGRDRKSWLIFCSGIEHAKNIRNALRILGITSETVSGETNAMERDFILSEFKAGRIRAVTNCDILTTGFNHPGIDLIAFLRPTQSTGLYVQMAGRGMRNAPGKSNCVILDFSGNIQRHGPIDLVEPKTSSRNGNGKAPVKTCPNCRTVLHNRVGVCPECGHKFPGRPEPTLDPTASARPIISPAAPIWVKVDKIAYRRHTKVGKPDSLRVDYYENPFTFYSEWVCLEHGESVTHRAIQWWRRRSDDPPPLTVTDALWLADRLKQPSEVLVIEQGKYWRIISYRFSEGEAPIVEVEDKMEYAGQDSTSDEEAPF